MVGALEKGPSDPEPFIWALGRLNKQSAASALQNFVTEGTGSPKTAAALALLRMGSLGCQRYCSQDPGNVPELLLPLALSGSGAAATALLAAARRLEALTPEHVAALGLLGDPAAIDLLLAQLDVPDNPALALAAADALNLITGADLYEELFEKEKMEKDELFAEEIEKLERGEPLFPAGQEPAVYSIQPVSKRPLWEAWLKGNKARFKPGIRLRRGEPYAPQPVIATLEAPRSSTRLRAWAADELLIRYKLDSGFDAMLLVRDQLVALKELHAAAAKIAPAPKPGTWCYAAKDLGGAT